MNRICITLFVLSVLSFAGDPQGDAAFQAVRDGDLNRLRPLVQKPEFANARNAQGATLLMVASLHASPAIMDFLLTQGADPKLSNPLGATALHWIAGGPAEYAAKTELLLQHGADPNATSQLGRTPLTIAAAFPGNAAALRLLLAKGADPKKVDANGDGPLGNAATSADTQMMKILLEAGANPNERGIRGPAMRGLTALMRATMANCLECVELLLARGADPNAVSDPPRVVKAGLQDVGKLTALLMAAQWNQLAIAKALVAAGAHLEAADARGLTPYLIAHTLEDQNPRVAEFLAARGARTDVKSKDGESAADWKAKWQPASWPAAPRFAKPELAPTVPLAVSRSLNLLLRSNETFFAKSGCVACHHLEYSGILAQAASQRGIPHDAALAKQQLNTMLAVSQPLRETSLQRVPSGGAPFANAVLLQSLAAQGVAPSPLTDALVHDIAGLQRPDGSWLGMTQRPPMEYSTVTETALAIFALRHYASPGRKADVENRIARARRWLESAPTPYTEEIVMRNLGLHWAGGRADHRQLLRLQRPDGGFAQRPEFPSDAYATGTVLYALASTGYDTRQPAYRAGVNYLLRNQAADGSWHVRSRSLKFQPYFESGFPYGHDQWISATATSWAALALTEALPIESSRASVLVHSAPAPAPHR